ncbi:hypothetical protein [Methylomonas fluvii]|nr:hypothetical protein [Methylomonas fluvii]
MESIEQHGLLQLDSDYPVIYALITNMHLCVNQIRQEIQSDAFKTIIYNANRVSKKIMSER